mmetsp:Transcript_84545/g.165461  ORF Transcript_84545/g.165461 Transcript_84545/m.165461 type:complete len:180 (+) Transcript_84545:21-560(+)
MYLQEEDDSDANPLANYWLEGDSLAPPCQAELDVVNAILDLAAPFVKEGCTFYDLGCGDGRICTEATRRFHCESIGCEIESHLIEKFKKNVELLKLEDKVTIVEGDLCDLDLQRVGIISIYLLPESVEIIKDKLYDAMERGSVVICNTWGLKGLQHKDKAVCGFAGNCNLFLYDASCLT